MLVGLKNSTLKSLLTVFGSAAARDSAVQGAAETEDVIVRGTFSRVLAAFMQPDTAYEEGEASEEVEGGEPEPEVAQGPRAGRGR